MILLYLLQLLLVAGALGLAAWSRPGVFAGLGAAVRVMMAVSLAPLALSVLTLGLAMLWPGAPRLVFQAVPGSLAVLLIAWLGRGGLSGLPLLRLAGLERVGLGIAALALVTVLFAGLRSAQPAPAAHDMLIYLTEARAFAQHPALTSIAAFDAAQGEVIKTHPHQFFFQAYLAQALMFAEGPIGYPNDLQARLAIQATLPLMMLGLFGLARTVVPAWTAALALPFMLFFHADYISVAGSIDAFRLAPFLVMAGVLIAAVTRREAPEWPALMFLGVLSGLTVAVHTLNIVIVFIAGFSVIVGAIAKFVRMKNAVYVFVSCVPFVAVGLSDKVANYISYGTPLGRGMYYFFYAGTPLEAVFSKMDHWTRTYDPLTAFWRFAFLAGPGLMMAAAGAALVMATRHVRAARGRPAMLGLMTSLVIWVPLTPGLGLQGAMLSNLRYGLAAGALAAVVLAVAAAMLIKWTTAGAAGDSPRRFAASGALATFIVVASGLAWLGLWNADWLATGALAAKLKTIARQAAPGVDPALTLQWTAALAFVLAPAVAAAAILTVWRWAPARWMVSGPRNLLVGTIALVPALLAPVTTSRWTYPVWSPGNEQVTRELTGLAERHAAGGAWVVDDYTIAYYATRPPLFLYAGNGAPLMHAGDVPETRRQLAIRRVRMVALKDQRREWWPSTTFFQALTSDPAIEQRQVGGWSVFLLPAAVPDTGDKAPER